MGKGVQQWQGQQTNSADCFAISSNPSTLDKPYWSQGTWRAASKMWYFHGKANTLMVVLLPLIILLISKGNLHREVIFSYGMGVWKMDNNQELLQKWGPSLPKHSAQVARIDSLPQKTLSYETINRNSQRFICLGFFQIPQKENWKRKSIDVFCGCLFWFQWK